VGAVGVGVAGWRRRASAAAAQAAAGRSWPCRGQGMWHLRWRWVCGRQRPAAAAAPAPHLVGCAAQHVLRLVAKLLVDEREQQLVRLARLLGLGAVGACEGGGRGRRRGGAACSRCWRASVLAARAASAPLLAPLRGKTASPATPVMHPPAVSRSITLDMLPVLRALVGSPRSSSRLASRFFCSFSLRSSRPSGLVRSALSPILPFMRPHRVSDSPLGSCPALVLFSEVSTREEFCVRVGKRSEEG
jgi:hypothetical protein